LHHKEFGQVARLTHIFWNKCPVFCTINLTSILSKTNILVIYGFLSQIWLIYATFFHHKRNISDLMVEFYIIIYKTTVFC
jgi:hypothetical protein